MSYSVFQVNSIAGKFQVAVKAQKDALAGDMRRDAWTVVIDQFGRSASVSQEAKSMRRLSAAFSDVPCAKGWGFIARAAA